MQDWDTPQLVKFVLTLMGGLIAKAKEEGKELAGEPAQVRPELVDDCRSLCSRSNPYRSYCSGGRRQLCAALSHTPSCRRIAPRQYGHEASTLRLSQCTKQCRASACSEETYVSSRVPLTVYVARRRATLT